MNGFTANASDLTNALALALASAERKTTIPILSFVLMESDGDGAVITGTDLDTSISVKIEAVDIKSFAFCVPAKQAHSLVSLFDGVVIFEAKDKKVFVRSGKSKYTLPAAEKKDFPAIESATGDPITISGEIFGSLLKSATIAMETDANGEDKWKTAEISAKDGKLTIAATCGRMLAFASVPATGEFSVVVPARGVQSLIAFAARSESLDLRVSANHLTVRAKDGTATVRLSTHQFPNWRIITNGSWPHSVELSSDLLVSAMKRASLTSEERVYPPNKLTFAFSRQSIEITSRGHDRGEGFEHVAAGCSTLNGDALRMGLFAGQLLDFLHASKQGMILDFKDTASSIRCKPIESLGFDFECIIMPAKAASD